MSGGAKAGDAVVGRHPPKTGVTPVWVRCSNTTAGRSFTANSLQSSGAYCFVGRMR